MSIEDGKFVPKAVNYWIYDKKDARNDKNLNHDYYRFERELGQDEYLPLPCKPANEKFFELDINDDDFYKSLKENLSEKSGKKNYNYLIVAFGSDLENLDFAEKICTKLKEWEIFEQTKVFVKIRDDKLKNDVIGCVDKDVDFIVFGNEGELVYNVNAIVNEKNEALAMDRHRCYELAYAYESEKKKAAQEMRDIVKIDEDGEKLKATRSWYKQAQFQREANIYGVLAIRMKLQLIGFDLRDKADGEKDASDEFMCAYEKDDPIVYDGSEIEGRKGVVYTNDSFKFDSLRGRMAIQEHQRWNAYAITCGMIPMPVAKMKEGKFKNFELRKHGCLTTFDGLVNYRKIRAEVEHRSEEETDVIRYDYQILDDVKWLAGRADKKIVKK